LTSVHALVFRTPRERGKAIAASKASISSGAGHEKGKR
jgi:hypothetical protein